MKADKMAHQEEHTEEPLAYTLTQLAAVSGLPASDIISIEQRGAIKSCRSTSGRRIYAHAEVAWLLGEGRR